MNTLVKVNGVSRRRIGCRLFSVTTTYNDSYKCKVLVVGGGSGGCAIAAKMASRLGKNSCIVLEPADRHYYQPMFTLIGGGIKNLSQSYRSMESVLPKKAKWIKDEATQFNAKSNQVLTKGGHTITYDVLVVAVGLQLKYDKIPGLLDALSVPNGNVTSIYSPKYVERHLNALKNFKEGNIIFSYPASPVKCPGAPQKICYITDDFLRKNNKRDKARIIYNTALPVIFGVKYFADALWKVVKKRDIDVNLKTNLVEVNADKNIAVFANVDNPRDKKEFKYSILHAVPPQGAPQVLLDSKEITNEAGFVDVNQATLQHVKFPNIFAIGDCSSTSNSKTMAAAAAQAACLQDNIMMFLQGKALSKAYDGYASCPLVTGYSKCIMAEFDYNLQPKETFPFRQDVERYSMFFVKNRMLPPLYWHLMLPGWWNGPTFFRNCFSYVKFSGK